VAVFGSEPLIYQWFNDGMAIANATNNLLPLSNLQSNQVGYYSVTVTNLYGWVASSNALLSIPGVPLPFQWQGLVAYYPFNGNANDESGDARNGTVNGAVSATNRFGNPSSAYVFAGTQNVTFGSVPLQQIDDWTLCAWISPSSLNQASMAVTVGYDNGVTGDGFELGISDGTSLPGNRLYGILGGVAVLDSGYVFPSANQWHQVAMLRAGGVTKFYVDGIRTANTSSAVPKKPTAFSIGSGTGIRFFQGQIDDIRIYNRALSSNEVAQLYAFEADMPVITAHPQNQAVAQGGTATFSVTATAANPLTYQWFKDGAVLTGATNTTLNLTIVQPNQIGYYSVAVSNAVTGALSASAALNISGYDFSQWQGLVAYYPFNGNANDESGNGKNGTVNGATLTTDRFDRASAAYSFDGVSGTIVIPDASGFRQNTLTLSGWVEASELSPGGRIRSDLIGKGASYQWVSQLEQSGKIRTAVFTSSGEQTFDSNLAINTNRWYQFTRVWDGVTGAVYINGVYDNSIATSGSLVNGSDPVVIGARLLNGNYFHGKLDDIRIYNRALSTNEVAQLYTFEADTPVITAQPQAGIVTQGSPVSFAVAATAQNPLTYQWSKDGVPISSATNATLLIPNVQPSQAGLYTVAISNGFTGVISTPAALAVVSTSGPGAPGFTSNQFGFGLSGPAASSFVVEASTNLQTWQPLSTNTFGVGLFQFVDPGSITNPIRFYRTRY